MVKNYERFKKRLKLLADGCNNFSDWKSLNITKRRSQTAIFDTLAQLEDIDEVDFFKDDVKAKRKLKKIALDIGNSGFFSKIKRLNQKNIKKYQ